MYYGTHDDGLKCMFVDLTYLQLDDDVSDNENYNQNSINEVGIIDIRGLMAMDEDSFFDNVDLPKGSFTPMDQALAYLHEIMAKITAGASVELWEWYFDGWMMVSKTPSTEWRINTPKKKGLGNK